jgi:hypothetical protein
MYSLGEKEENQDCGQSAQCCLQVKNNAPTPVCHDDATDKWTGEFSEKFGWK